MGVEIAEILKKKLYVLNLVYNSYKLTCPGILLAGKLEK